MSRKEKDGFKIRDWIAEGIEAETHVPLQQKTCHLHQWGSETRQDAMDSLQELMQQKIEIRIQTSSKHLWRQWQERLSITDLMLRFARAWLSLWKSRAAAGCGCSPPRGIPGGRYWPLGQGGGSVVWSQAGSCGATRLLPSPLTAPRQSAGPWPSSCPWSLLAHRCCWRDAGANFSQTHVRAWNKPELYDSC